MGLVSNFAVVGGVACTIVYAGARLLALLVVLRGTRPHQRAELVRAVAELFRRGRRTSAPEVAPQFSGSSSSCEQGSLRRPSPKPDVAEDSGAIGPELP